MRSILNIEVDGNELDFPREEHLDRRSHDACIVDVAEGRAAADPPSGCSDGNTAHLGSSGHRG